MFRRHFHRRVVAYFFVCTIFVMGMVFGSLAVRHVAVEQREELSHYLSSFFQTFDPGTTLSKEALARRSIMDNVVKTVGLMWLLGLSLLGAPLVLVIIFIRGFTFGFTLGFLVQEMFLRGIVVALASILPHNIIILPAIIIAGAAAMGFSWSVLRVLAGNRSINVYQQFLITTSTNLLAAGLLVGAAFIEAYITPVLIDLVNTYLI
ncbi:MAG: stage II sporulation protein M [Firmicutes bacterium]|nr:stage II sporulation protein M [Bacillota bacterium]